MIDTNHPTQFADLMVRAQARRVAQAYQGAGGTIPLHGAAVVAGDTEEALERDSAAFEAWYAARGAECVRAPGSRTFGRHSERPD